MLPLKRLGQLVHAHALLLHGHIERRLDRHVHGNSNTYLPTLQTAWNRNIIPVCDPGTDGFGKTVGSHLNGVAAIFALGDCIRQIGKRHRIPPTGLTLQVRWIRKIHVLSPYGLKPD